MTNRPTATAPSCGKDAFECYHEFDEWRKECVTEMACGHEVDEWQARCAQCFFAGCQECHIWENELCEGCQRERKP